ncbi:ankyrin repeat-containing domain protein [Coprinopsis sp. MPI-PUGE-AT-0042]|nr:ankyrin repeat-containing domain protein [Coprinopsis sp. MPI-PUGE-AT-0042]
MGASFSTWARWDDTVVQQVLASEAHPIQNSGTAIIQGAQNLTITGGVFNLNNQQAASTPDPERLRKSLDFLSLVNFRSIQQENFGKWTPGTVKWLLESSMFQFWLDTQHAILWGTGMPGAGKTILASVVIEDLQARARECSDICVAFVYCRYTEPMKVRNILAALVRQLLERFPHLLSSVEPLYLQHELEGTKPSQKELIDVIRGICSHFRTAYLFIDGLDEALYDEQFDLLDTLKSVHANFFITSRPLSRLKDVLPNAKFFNIAATEEEVELLVSQHIDCNPDLQQVLATDAQRERVIKKICESSQGMFLHASLMVEAIRHCTSSRHVMEQLGKLPAKLDILYEEVFKRIEMQPEEHAALAKRVLLWVAYGFRSLTVDELRYAVASDPKVDWAAPNNLVPESLLVSVCCGLVAVECYSLDGMPWPESDAGSDRVVRLVHYTALGPVKRMLNGWEASPHCILAELCVERLMHCGIPHRQPKYEPAPTWSWPIQPPLQNYAYESWHLHASESIQSPAEPNARPVATILRFLAMCKAFSALDSNPDHSRGGQSRFDNFTKPIHLAAYYHLPLLLPLIDPQVNERTRRGRSALALAAWRGDTVMVEALLKLDGIDVNLQNRDGNTALMLAAGRGSADVVKALLLDPRIDTHKRNEKNETALHCALHGTSSHPTACPLHFIATQSIDETASSCALLHGTGRGHTASALYLIASLGVDVNAADDHGRTPLMLAYSHSRRLLDSLAQHPNINLFKMDKNGWTPLMHACHWGPSSAVRWYLKLPGVDARDNSGASALAHRAQRRSSPAMTYQDCLLDFLALIEAGLDVNEKDAMGFTALTHAVQSRNLNAVRTLLQIEQVDVNSEDDEGKTLLMVACDAESGLFVGKEANKAIPLHLLLQHPGLEVNTKSKHGTSAVAYAVAKAVLETMNELVTSLQYEHFIAECEDVQQG